MFLTACVVFCLFKSGASFYQSTRRPAFQRWKLLLTMTTEDMSTTELPASFEESVTSAVQSTLACKADGNLRLRVDFDTSMGDETYTKLKSSMLFTQKFVSQISSFHRSPFYLGIKKLIESLFQLKSFLLLQMR